MIRDTQRSRVYAAERMLPEFRLMDLGDTPSVAEVQKFVNAVLKRKRVRDRFPRLQRPPEEKVWQGVVRSVRTRAPKRPHVEVHDGRRRRRPGGWYNGITMPRWSRNRLIVLHELAHSLSPISSPHDWEYCANYLFLVRQVMGSEVERRLKAAFKTHRVRYTKPRAKRPLTEAQKQALRDRLAQYRQTQQETVNA